MKDTITKAEIESDALPVLLLVDDDAAFCSVLKRALERLGQTIAVAHSINEALSVADTFQPGRAVVDLKLGTDSGLHLIKPLLALNPRMEIIVLTGYGSIPTTVEAIKAGAINYLAKPVDVAQLVRLVDALVAPIPEHRRIAG